jgi:predicted transcriptional regulator
MKKEPIYTYLRRRLSELAGQHNRIAKESGVPQATVSRIHAGLCSPRLDTVQPLLDWFEKHDKRASALRIPNTRSGLKARRARGAATAALSE